MKKDKENRVNRVQRIKINLVNTPTNDWGDFEKIFTILQKETILASNRIINVCNIYNGLGKDNQKQWLLDSYNNDKIRSVLYSIARNICIYQYSGSANMISDQIYKKYFQGENSYKKKIEKGEGNPPMSFTEKIPIYVRGDLTKIECVNYDRGYYSLSSSFLGLGAKNGLDYETKENGSNKIIKHHIDINDRKLKFNFTIKRSGRLEKIIENIMNPDSGYKIGDSQLMRKKKKNSNKYEYYFLLAYSFEKENIPLNPERILGVDVGEKIPLYATVNQDISIKGLFGDNSVHKLAMKDEKIRQQKQIEITYNLKDGHERKYKLDGFNGADNKTKHRQNTYNHVLAKKLIAFAIQQNCGTIHLEDLSKLKKKDLDNFFLRTWTYYNLQQKIIEKANEKGIVVCKVNRFGTSQTCPVCGYRDKKNRPKGKKGQAYFKCIKCGYSDNADYVAAINISRATPLKNKIYK